MLSVQNCNYLKNCENSEKFNKFKDFLLEKNREFNLTSITDEREIFVKHFVDSLSASDFINNGSRVIEIGSGGGFPSVPLKIFRDDINFTLVEATGKKCAFLNHVKELLNFENFNVLNARCEDLAKKAEFREQFDVCVARAVARLNTLCEYMLPFVKIGGIMIAYKSECKEEATEAAHAIKELGGRLKTVENYSLEDGFGERTLVIIEKIKSTPQKYPRGNGKERSKPL